MEISSIKGRSNSVNFKIDFCNEFPDHFTFRDLWRVCEAYGKVIDVFIPNRKSKAGKRFAFVRFIKVEYLDRLVEILSTIWIGRLRLHVNIVRFEKLSVKTTAQPKGIYRSSPIGSYVSVLKTGKTESYSTQNTSPSLVLDESCILENDCKLSVMGKAKISKGEKKDYYSSDEESVKGGLKDKHRVYDNGNPMVNDSDVEEVSETNFTQGDNHLEVPEQMNKNEVNSNMQSKDPFQLYDLLNKKKDEGIQISEDNLQYSSGFTPVNNGVILTHDKLCEGEVVHKSPTTVSEERLKKFSHEGLEKRECVKKEVSPQKTNDFQKDQTKDGGSILNLMDELIKVGQAMGYNMDGCIENIGVIIGEQGDNDGLVDLPLRGYSFTWAHKSATKMSKLDRFLISEGLLVIFPHLGAICLDLHLSDHRLILLKEMYYDFSAIPFRIFHSWFQRDCFDKMVEETWKKLDVTDNNRLIRLKKKLQMLKQEIRSWIKKEKSSSSMAKDHTQKKLTDIDSLLDQGRVNMEILNQRTELMKSLNDINSLETMEAAQKAKLSIKGAFVNGQWVTNPIQVKHAFFSYFASRFKKIEQIRAHLDTQFPNVLSTDQVEELEKEVTYDEVKAAVWDCGENKSPGLDGYTFEFFRSKKYKAMLFKVDFEKAYDSIRRDYLDDILHNFGFGKKRRMWIKGCLSSYMGSALVNGSPSSEFQFFKGLKKGDHLSPFLFILVMEILHISFSRVMQAGDWNDSNLSTIVHVLKCFFLASGLKINVSKSKIMGIRVESGVVERAATVVGYSTLTAPFSYLEVQVGDCMSRSQTWEDVIRKISAWLSRCKVKTLSIGGRCIQAFHGIRGSLDCYRKNKYRESLWTYIIKEAYILKDVWMGDLSLKCKFPRLYALETCKHVSIAMKLSSDSVSSSFRRGPRGGIESEQYEDL
ncbi:RNA-directed DNA polymerase, eukaryota, partial [Tanacetum coccineum]